MVKNPLTNFEPVFVSELDKMDIIYSYRESFGIDVAKFFRGKLINLYEDIGTGYKFYYPFDISGDEKFYEQLSKNDWYYMDWKWEHEVVFGYLKKGMKVLEIGSGKGTFVRKAKENGVDITGVELNLDEVMKGKLNGLKIINEDIVDFALKHKGEFDIVCSFQVMEHVSNIGEVLRSSLKCLKVGGKLVISVPNNDSFGLNGVRNILNVPPHHVGLWGEKSLRKLENFFDIKLIEMKCEPLQDYHIDLYSGILHEKLTKHWFFRTRLLRFVRPIISKFRHIFKGLTVVTVFEKIS